MTITMSIIKHGSTCPNAIKIRSPIDIGRKDYEEINIEVKDGW